MDAVTKQVLDEMHGAERQIDAVVRYIAEWLETELKCQSGAVKYKAWATAHENQIVINTLRQIKNEIKKANVA